METQIMFCMLAPSLIIPAVLIAIPLVCMVIPAMALAGVSVAAYEMNTMTAFTHVLDRQRFHAMGGASKGFAVMGMGSKSKEAPARLTRAFGGAGGTKRSLPRRSNTFAFGSRAK
jgi:hypothetical protein